MGKIKYLFSAGIIALLCCVTALAYEAESFDDYASFVSEMVSSSQGDITLMSVDDGEFESKRIYAQFYDKAYLPEGINPVSYVVYDDIGVFFFATAAATERAYNLLEDAADVKFVEADRVITFDTGSPQIELYGQFEDIQARIESRNWSFENAGVYAYRDYANSKKADEVVIGIIDTGLAITHPYFADSERLLEGYNITDPSKPVADSDGHGTHVAGIAMSTSSENVKIKMYQLYDTNRKSSKLYFFNALQKAIEDNVDVINISLSVASCSDDIHTALDEAYEKGIVVVAAAGNGDRTGVAQPAQDICPAHHHEKVITVGASASDNTVATFSNYGAEVDICAPGVAIYSTYCDPDDNHKNTYATTDGTSMSTPLVASFVAMMKSADPNMTYDRLMLMMKECATKPDGWDAERNGEGILNMGACASLVEYVYPINAQFANQGEFTFDLSLENLSEDKVDFMACIVFCDKNGVQIGSQIDTFSIKSGKKPNYSIYIDDVPYGAASVSAYVWTSDMVPLCMTRHTLIN